MSGICQEVTEEKNKKRSHLQGERKILRRIRQILFCEEGWWKRRIYLRVLLRGSIQGVFFCWWTSNWKNGENIMFFDVFKKQIPKNYTRDKLARTNSDHQIPPRIAKTVGKFQYKRHNDSVWYDRAKNRKQYGSAQCICAVGTFVTVSMWTVTLYQVLSDVCNVGVNRFGFWKSNHQQGWFFPSHLVSSA